MLFYFHVFSGRTGLKPEKDTENSDLESISSRQSSRQRQRREYSKLSGGFRKHYKSAIYGMGL